MNTTNTHNQILDLKIRMAKAIIGQEHVIEQLLIALLANGHVLMEGLPGLAKTRTIKTLAANLESEFRRIQFTPDLLPSDITGTEIYVGEAEGDKFQFQQGPVFGNLILADEINRAPAKAQSALLEAMEERQVTADGQTCALPEPFFVIATQNPAHQVGTFPLPESQLDRFLLRIRLGYPDPQAERALLMGEDRRGLLERHQAVIGPAELLEMQQAAQGLHVAEALVAYVQALLAATRNSAELAGGLSPRAGLGLLAAARAWALLDGRDHVLPEDVQALFPHVAAHRVHLAGDGRPVPPATLLRLLQAVAVG